MFSVVFYISLKEIKVTIEDKRMDHLFQNVTCKKTRVISQSQDFEDRMEILLIFCIYFEGLTRELDRVRQIAQ